MEILFYIFVYFLGYIISLGILEFDEENGYAEYITLFIFWPLLILIFIVIIFYFCLNTLFNRWKKL